MRAVATLVAVLLLASSACGILEPGPETFVVRADSVVGPEVVARDDGISVAVYARLGPNLCYRFKEFQVVRDPLGAKVTIVGTHSGSTCATMPAAMMGTVLTIPSPSRGPFELRIMQPDGGELGKTIQVQ